MASSPARPPPPDAASLDRSRSPLVGAVRFSENFWFEAPSGGWRNAFSWLPPEPVPLRAVIILFHGYGEHALRYQPLGEAWAQQGLAVYAMDHARHGHNLDNTGFTGMRRLPFANLVGDAVGFIEYVHGRHAAAPFFLMGHSMGGLVALLAALRVQERHRSLGGFRGMVLSAPALRVGGQGLVPRHSVYSPAWQALTRLLDTLSAGFWPNTGAPTAQCTTTKGFGEANDADERHFGGMICAGWGVQFVDASEYALSRAAEVRCPFYICHGGADVVVLPAGTAALHARASTPAADKEKVVYPSLLHEALNEPQRHEVMEDMLRWVRSRL